MPPAGRVDQTTVPGVLIDHRNRIRALEAVRQPANPTGFTQFTYFRLQQDQDFLNNTATQFSMGGGDTNVATNDVDGTDQGFTNTDVTGQHFAISRVGNPTAITILQPGLYWCRAYVAFDPSAFTPASFDAAISTGMSPSNYMGLDDLATQTIRVVSTNDTGLSTASSFSKETLFQVNGATTDTTFFGWQKSGHDWTVAGDPGYPPSFIIELFWLPQNLGGGGGNAGAIFYDFPNVGDWLDITTTGADPNGNGVFFNSTANFIVQAPGFNAVTTTFAEIDNSGAGGIILADSGTTGIELQSVSEIQLVNGGDTGIVLNQNAGAGVITITSNNDVFVDAAGNIIMSSLPIVAPATPGALWNNGGVLNIV